MNEYIVKLDTMLEEYLVKKAPALSKNTKEILVKIAPWFAILGVILGVPAILAVFGLGAFMTPFALVTGTRTGMFWVWWIVGLVQVVISAMSIKPLFARTMRGWELMLYSQLLSFVTSLGNFSVLSLVFTILWFYFLYQVKDSYKTK
jgi:hypothetical protein